MTFIREQMPDAQSYFSSMGLTLSGKGKWRTTECQFHGGSDSLRVNVESGGWVCMSCGAKGGDAVAHHMQLHGMDFAWACTLLGCWHNDGKPYRPQKPKSLQPRDAIEALQFESMLILVVAGDYVAGRPVSAADHRRLAQAVGRVQQISLEYRTS